MYRINQITMTISEIRTSLSYEPNEHELISFFIELLMNREYSRIIRWTENGDFQLMDPEEIARYWGVRINKPSMNYEKFSRSIRYYYEDILVEIDKSNHIYTFAFDVRTLTGYSVQQLATISR